MSEYHGPAPSHPEIPPWAEQEAWEAFHRARADWRERGAPSVGARAKALLRGLLYPPSYIDKCEAALALYLAPWQMAERNGELPKRRRFRL